jgi:hypothetical protein
MFIYSQNNKKINIVEIVYVVTYLPNMDSLGKIFGYFSAG